jgi:AcrR family transcriptional regulator
LDDEVAAKLPASMALAWGVGGPGSRGPKKTLTIGQIVDAGIAIAVADGITAVSMSRVAERLGVSTMALYRYVTAKDDLLELMVDTALGRPPDAKPGETWRDGLRRWAEGCRDGYRANPWALHVPISAPPLGPNNIRWLENALSSLRDTPLGAQQKLSCVLMISSYTRDEERLLHDLLTSQTAGRDPKDYGLMLASLITKEEFPEVCAALLSGALSDEDGVDHDFDFGVERILDGIAVLIADQDERHG